MQQAACANSQTTCRQRAQIEVHIAARPAREPCPCLTLNCVNQCKTIHPPSQLEFCMTLHPIVCEAPGKAVADSIALTTRLWDHAELLHQSQGVEDHTILDKFAVLEPEDAGARHVE